MIAFGTFLLERDGDLAEEQCPKCGGTGKVKMDKIKVEVCDIVVARREVEIPTKCPKCGVDLTQENLLVWEYQDQKRHMGVEISGEEAGFTWPDLPHGGETFMQMTFQCACCNTMLAEGKELEDEGGWGDKPLPEDEAINDAFPTRSGDHESYGEAMRLVSARHSKFGLVALVHWLLTRIKRKDEVLKKLENLILKSTGINDGVWDQARKILGLHLLSCKGSEFEKGSDAERDLCDCGAVEERK